MCFALVSCGEDDDDNDSTVRKSKKKSTESVDKTKSFDKSALQSAAIGSYITFGKYEQDNDSDNGAETIEWLVLAKEDDKILVISRFGLDCHEYNPSENITWENCSLRAWLNDTFYNSAFSSGEQSAILLSTVPAEANPIYETPAGNDTSDRVFLLSIGEAKKYFADNDARICPASAYVASKTDNLLEGNCWWWLRSPGYALTNAAGVNGWGGVGDQETRVWSKTGVVRPAMWISIAP